MPLGIVLAVLRTHAARRYAPPRRAWRCRECGTAIVGDLLRHLCVCRIPEGGCIQQCPLQPTATLSVPATGNMPP
jgi:hypothetical protein